MSVKFQNGNVYENNILIGKVNNNEIRNKVGTLLGKTVNDVIRNPVGTVIGKVSDGYVRSPIGTRMGGVKDYMIDGMQHEKDANIVAAYHFLVKKIF